MSGALAAILARCRAKAEKVARDPAAAATLLDAAVSKAKGGGIEHVRAEFLDMVRMLKAYFKGDYRRIPWTTLVTALGGALYFVNPLDLIPDFLVGPGLLDDAAVIAFCLRGLRQDLAAFVRWERATISASQCGR